MIGRAAADAVGQTLSRTVELPFQLGAAVREARLFHPDGFVAAGRLTPAAGAGAGLPICAGAVVCRMSKAIGTPGGLPDITGLAVRVMPSGGGAAGPRTWDILLASGMPGAAKLPTPIPARTWDESHWSSLVPYAYRGELWWLRARIVAPETDDLEVLSLERALGEHGVVIVLEEGRVTGPFTELATITLDRLDPDLPADLAFDPVRLTPPGVSLRPIWLGRLRDLAYRGSQRGRA